MSKEKDEGLVWEDFPKYTEDELDEFAAWLEKFRVKHKVTFPKAAEVSFVDERAAAVAFGAMRKTMHQGQPHYSVVMMETEKSTKQHGAKWAYPSKYDTFQDKLKQLEKLRWRRGKSEQKKIEGLEDLARGMEV